MFGLGNHPAVFPVKANGSYCLFVFISPLQKYENDNEGERFTPNHPAWDPAYVFTESRVCTQSGENRAVNPPYSPYSHGNFWLSSSFDIVKLLNRQPRRASSLKGSENSPMIT